MAKSEKIKGKKDLSAMKKCTLLLACLLLASCGDFPDYEYDQTENYCNLSFPFAGGFIGRKYIGYLNIMSSFQFVDENPSLTLFISGPSHIKLEVGSVQKIEIADQVYRPEFKKNYFQPELQYMGPAFIFDEKQSAVIYKALQDGYDLTIVGRLEINSQYETDIYNFFFEDIDKPFRTCVNQLLDDDDLRMIEENNQLIEEEKAKKSRVHKHSPEKVIDEKPVK